MTFPTEHEWVDYAITQPISKAEVRAKLKSEVNKTKLYSYSLSDGPFKNFADLGQLTKKVYLRIGNKPPALWQPNPDASV